jgi:hypothetical protein
MSGNAPGIPRELGESGRSAGQFFVPCGGEGGGHSSPMAITILPRPGDICRFSGQGGALLGSFL